jgi:pimeloyl-ACP methyl ester carboxylesterase
MIHSIQSFINVKGSRLHYEEAGSGSPIVLIHGFSADSRVWDFQFEAFAQQYHVIRLDLRGHGISDAPDGQAYSYADDLNALLEHLQIPQASIVGQSMGGGIAIDFALAYPHKTSSLVLVDSTLDGYEWSEDWNQSWLPIYRQFGTAGASAATPLLAAHPLFTPGFRQPVVKDRLTKIMSEYSGWHLLHDDPIIENDPPAIQRLGQIHAPALVLVGELSLPDFHSISAILAQEIPNARKVVLEDVGYVAPMEAPEQFNQLVLSFLNNPTP